MSSIPCALPDELPPVVISLSAYVYITSQTNHHRSLKRQCISWRYLQLPLLTFLLGRTGLEAIMETYAFWRPPVRTLTFEDFTTMQKQQGKVVGHGLCLVIVPRRVGAELNIAHLAPGQAMSYTRSSRTKSTW